MKYLIICRNCKKTFALDDEEFSRIVNDMMHNHIFPILEDVMRCCEVPSIDFYEIEDDVWQALYE